MFQCTQLLSKSALCIGTFCIRVVLITYEMLVLLRAETEQSTAYRIDARACGRCASLQYRPRRQHNLASILTANEASFYSSLLGTAGSYET